MQTENSSRNIEHYDSVYSKVSIERNIRIVRNFHSFLDNETKRETSWHGFYQDDFASRINGKKVLELGCGDGINALIMAALGADVVANDISAESEKIIYQSATVLQLTNSTLSKLGQGGRKKRKGSVS